MHDRGSIWILLRLIEGTGDSDQKEKGVGEKEKRADSKQGRSHDALLETVDLLVEIRLGSWASL